MIINAGHLDIRPERLDDALTAPRTVRTQALQQYEAAETTLES